MAGTTRRPGDPRKVRGLVIGKVHNGVDFRMNIFFLFLGDTEGDEEMGDFLEASACPCLHKRR
jgi:hypothetical protein